MSSTINIPMIKKRKSLGNNQRRREALTGYLFLMPNFLGFLFFMAIPVFASLIYSFTNYNGFKKMDFIGLQNYIRLFQDSYFRISLLNNIAFTLFAVPLSIIFGLLIAVLLNNKLFGGNMFRAVMFFPNLASVVAVAVVWKAMFNVNTGPINVFLRTIGIMNVPEWLHSPEWALPAIIIVAIWQSTGYNMVLFLGGLQGIPKDLYEAASIDGANLWQQFRYVTIPMLKHTIFLVSVLGVIGSFKVFGIVHVMTEGGPGRSTNVLVYRIYQEAFVNYKFGYASSMAFVLFAIIFIFTLIQFQIQKKNEM